MHARPDRRLVLLVAGQAVNAVGSWCALVALWGFAAYRYDAGPARVALLGLVWALPAALAGPVAGVHVDRLGPRRVLVVADLAAAAVALLLATAGSFGGLVGLGLLLGCTKAFSEPAFSALPPRLVDDRSLFAANAWLEATTQAAIALGPLLAAGAIALWGFRSAFVIDAATYLVGVAVVAPLRLGPLPVADGTVGAQVVDGLRAVRAKPDLRRLLALATAVYVVWGAYAVVEPIYVRDVLHRSPTTFALLQTAFGVVLLANGVLLPAVGDRAARRGVLLVAALVSGLAAAVYVGTSSLFAAFVGVAVWGGATAWFVAPYATLVQRAAPVELHGRVFGLDATLRSWAHLLAVTLAGALAAAAGVQVAAFAFAAVPVAAVVVVHLRTTTAPRPPTTPRPGDVQPAPVV